MSDKFQAFIQAAVRLDVQVFRRWRSRCQELLRVAVNRAAVVDFEFNAEMTQTFAWKTRSGV